jgi:hypothetical protein
VYSYGQKKKRSQQPASKQHLLENGCVQKTSKEKKNVCLQKKKETLQLVAHFFSISAKHIYFLSLPVVL